MAAGKGGPTILFIDDDADFVFALSKILQGGGFSVRHAENGEAGVRMAEEDPPDLIILDFMMPKMNGFEACGQLRQIDALRDVPILAMTAFGQNIGEVYGLGAETGQAYIQEFLEKPVEPNVLLERVKSLLAGRAGNSACRPPKQ